MPGSGKTTLARLLGDALFLPVVHRDAVKESFARLAEGPPEQLGAPSFVAFYDIVATHLRVGVGVVAEAAFHAEWSRSELEALAGLGRAVVVHCAVPAALAAERFGARAARGERHPCHPDERHLAEARADPRYVERYGPAPLDAPTLVVDTSDGYRPSLGDVVSFVERSHRVDA